MFMKKTGSFLAMGDDGYRYTIYIYTHFIDAGTLENPKAVLQGIKEFRTSNGLAVNWIKKGKYEIVQTNVVLSSDDVDAP